MNKTPESHLADPFGEYGPVAYRRSVVALGARFDFESDAAELLNLMDHAYASLPAHRLSEPTPSLRIRLRLHEEDTFSDLSEPPDARMQGGPGFLGAVMDSANLSLVCPEARAGLVSFSRGLLRFPYHARYELLEFAVFTLASRVQQLIPLHAGCVGLKGIGALLVGESGAGKSTLSAHCLLQGLDFLTEDAAFVEPRTLLTTGLPNFLHLRRDALPFFADEDPTIADRIRNSPVIRRRSGVEKFEIDLRHAWGRIAPAPLKLGAVIFITRNEVAEGSEALVRLPGQEIAQRLAANQPYARQQPGWSVFAEQLTHLAGYELRRGPHPRDAATALRQVLLQQDAAT